MEKIEYPKWKYHFVKEAMVVKNAAEEAALGADWVDSPADAKASDVEPIEAPKPLRSKRFSKSSAEDKA